MLVLIAALTLFAPSDYLDAPPIISGAEPLEEPGRYRSPRSFDETLDYYQRIFNQAGGVRWRIARRRSARTAARAKAWSGNAAYVPTS